jgi:hypothetical protein
VTEAARLKAMLEEMQSKCNDEKELKLEAEKEIQSLLDKIEHLK